MKTITMDFHEYETLVGERNKARDELLSYQDAVRTVFGPEEAKLLLEKASEIRDSRARFSIHNAFIKGEL